MYQSTIKDSSKIKIEDASQPVLYSRASSLKYSDTRSSAENVESPQPSSLLIIKVRDCLSLGFNQLSIKVCTDDQVKLDDQLKLNDESITSNYIKLPFNKQEWLNSSSEVEYQLKFKLRDDETQKTYIINGGEGSQKRCLSNGENLKKFKPGSSGFSKFKLRRDKLRLKIGFDDVQSKYCTNRFDFGKVSSLKIEFNYKNLKPIS